MLASRVDDAAASAGELARRAELDALRDAVEALGDRPPGDPELADRVAELGPQRRGARRARRGLVRRGRAAGGDRRARGAHRRCRRHRCPGARRSRDAAATVAELASHSPADRGAVGRRRAHRAAGRGAAGVAGGRDVDGSGARYGRRHRRADGRAISPRCARSSTTSPPCPPVSTSSSDWPSRADELAESLRVVRDELAEVAGRPAGDPGSQSDSTELGARVAALARSVESVDDGRSDGRRRRRTGRRRRGARRRPGDAEGGAGGARRCDPMRARSSWCA